MPTVRCCSVYSGCLNDPTTAVQVIDRLDGLLAELMPRDIRAPKVLTAGSALVATVPAPDWNDYVELATREVGHASRGLPQDRRHLRAVLESNLRPARQPALRRTLTALGPTEGRDGDPESQARLDCKVSASQACTRLGATVSRAGPCCR